MNETILNDLKEAVRNATGQEVNALLSFPTNLEHGDYTSNVALLLAKQLGKNPLEIAQKIATHFPKKDYVEKVTAVAPGFVNIQLSVSFLLSEMEKVLVQRSGFGTTTKMQGKKIMVEFTDPNPFKEFHIGHLYSNVVGESMCRLFESQGSTVWRANFFGDVGMHAAKAIFGIQKKLGDEGLTLKDLEQKPLLDRVAFMGKAYALGSMRYEEDEAVKEEIKRLNLLIFIAAQQYWQETKNLEPKVDYKQHIQGAVDQKELLEIKELWATGREWSLEYFEIIYKRLGTKFDGYYPESLTGEWGYEVVLMGLEKGIFEKSEGAIVYRGEKHGLHTRVFVNKLGLPTYETKDIGNAPYKYSEFPYDRSYIVTGNEINEYFKVVIAAMKEVNPLLGEKTVHVGHGMVRLKEGKMSSRTGKILTGQWLLSQAKRRIREAYKEMDEQTSETVAVGAVKYALLRSGIGKDIQFGFDESISLEGNSGPYLQYTYARTQSVLRKSQISNGKWKMEKSMENGKWKMENEEVEILRSLHRFPKLVEQAATGFTPNLLCSYLFELGQAFNLFYQKHPILESQHSSFRLGLTKATGVVLQNGLNLLGIATPERM